MGTKLLLALALFWVGFAASAKADPTKNAAGYYELASAKDLKWFSEQVKSGQSTLNAVLTADIDLSTLGDSYWTPIGYYSLSENKFALYKGKFDGQNHTVTGLVIRPANCSGLFGVTDGATISNITVSYATLGEDKLVPGDDEQTGLAAICGNAINTVIRNCRVQNAIVNPIDNPYKKSLQCVGGIVGFARQNTHVVNCSVSGYVMANSETVGGIAGSTYGAQIDSCQVTASANGVTKIQGTCNVGGIVGRSGGRSAAAAVTECSVDNAVKIIADSIMGNVCGR